MYRRGWTGTQLMLSGLTSRRPESKSQEGAFSVEPIGLPNTFLNRLDSILTSPIRFPWLTDRQIEYINRYSSEELSDILIDYVETDHNVSVQSMAFDCLMNLKDFDCVDYIHNALARSKDSGWRLVYCKRLVSFRDPRVVQELCHLLAIDQDPDVRFLAANLLGEIGDISVLPFLEDAAERDHAESSYEWPVSKAAKEALQMVRREPGARQRIVDWVDRQ
jgi:hypothetical protein